MALIYGSGGILAPLASQWMWGYTLGQSALWRPADQMRPAAGKALWAVVAAGPGAGRRRHRAVGRRRRADRCSSPASSPSTIGIGDGREPSPYAFLVAFYIVMIPFLILYAIAGLLYRAGTRNVALNETIIDGRHVLPRRSIAGAMPGFRSPTSSATLFTLGPGKAVGGDPHGELPCLGHRARHHRLARRLYRHRQGFRHGGRRRIYGRGRVRPWLLSRRQRIIDGQIIEGLWRAPGVARARPARCSLDATGMATVGDAHTGDSTELGGVLAAVHLRPRRLDPPPPRLSRRIDFETRDNDGDRPAAAGPIAGGARGWSTGSSDSGRGSSSSSLLVVAFCVALYRFAVPVLVEVAVAGRRRRSCRS